MRDFSGALRQMSLNTATVRRQSDLLGIIEACARHGIPAISPWRDQVAAVGLGNAGRAIRQAGLKLSGYCRGGMFPASGEHLAAAHDDNRRAVDEAAALGAPCLILVAGGLPQFSRPGSHASKDLGGARTMIEDGIGRLLEHARTAGLPLAIEPLHPMYAADRAAVNTLAQALDIAAKLDPDKQARWAWPSTSITSGGIPTFRPASSAPAAKAGCSPITFVTGWCRRRTC